MSIYYFFIYIYRVLYELVTGKRTFSNYLSERPIAIYQLIHNPKFNFFSENELTGNSEFD